MATVRVVQSGGLRWKYLPEVEIDTDCFLTCFKEQLLSLVRPKWQPESVSTRVFEDGTTNKLIALFDRNKGFVQSGKEVVLVRINGVGTEAYIDRDSELLTMALLHKTGKSPPIYYQLKNGLCYGFVPGRQLDVMELQDEEMMKRVVRAMVKLHLLELPTQFKKREPVLWERMDKWLSMVPEKFEDPEKQKSFSYIFGSIDALKRNIEELRTKVGEFEPQIGFCHNDLSHANIIYNQEDDTVTPIDFEYGGPNFMIFDIANHFCEFGGVENVDYSRYPSEIVQKYWIRLYLEEKVRQIGEGRHTPVKDEAVRQLYRAVNKFALASHLFWSVWALLQAANSTIDFDFIEYAGKRYCEFVKKKDTFYAL